MPRQVGEASGAGHFARRRRRRRTAASPATVETPAVADEPGRPDPAVELTAPPDPGAPRSRARQSDPMERVWRDLTGAGPSRVGVDGALRARDVNRPTPEDLATAEREVVIVRRNWTPPAGPAGRS
jgi:hypothetical protein